MAVEPEVQTIPSHALDPDLLAAMRRLEPAIEGLGFQWVAALRAPRVYVWEDEEIDWEEALYVNAATIESCSVWRLGALEYVRFLTESTSGPYVETRQQLGPGSAPDLSRLYDGHQERVAAELPAHCGRGVPTDETAAAWLRRHLAEYTASVAQAGWAAQAGARWYRLTLCGAAVATWEHWRTLVRREPKPPPPGHGFDVLPPR